jgi:hypothetical protein
MFLHLYRPSGAERVAVVSLRPSSSGEGFLVQVASGPTRAKLGNPHLYGPASDKDAQAIFAREVAALKEQGFVRSGLGSLLTALASKKRRTRALAARRLGWLRETGAFDALLALAQKANEELPVVVDALGELGDPRAIPFCRTVAEKKLLSRRRAGVEALRKLEDAPGMAEAKNRALERLPSSVRAALASRDENSRAPSNVTPVVDVVLAVPVKDRGLAIDTLYEIGGALGATAAHDVMVKDKIDQPHLWRYTKSIFKRSMLRHDVGMFGWLAHGIEHVGRKSKGAVATVKSGFDGEMHTTPIFGKKTQDYLRRAAWRYMRGLGHHRPSWYPYAAAEVLVHYSTEDEDEPSGRYGTYARCYLLHQILYGASARYELLGRRMKFRLRKGQPVKAPAGTREEAFGELWDLQPRAYLRVLGGAHLAVAHEFALAAIRRAHMDVVVAATSAEIVAMLAASYPPTVELALDELRRRFDPQRPDWELLVALLGEARPNVRDLGIEWVGLTSKLWATNAERVLAFLAVGDATTRAAVVRHVLLALPRTDESERRAMATAIVAILRTPEPSEGAYDAHAQIAQELAEEIAKMVDVEELVALLSRGSVPAKSMAARALARRPGAGELLGIPQLLAMALHEQVALREASHALFLQVLPSLQRDPSPVYELLESEWADTRAFAAGLLKDSIDTSSLTPDALIALCDSNRVDVQNLGRELVERWMQRLDPQDLIKRLSQHPHRNVRKWALGLVTKHLKDGFVPLAGLEDFFRTVLLDVTPDRAMKHAAVVFLTTRGLADERQAEVVVRLLGEFVRSKTKDDFDRAIRALTRIKIAYPAVDSAVSLRQAQARDRASA